MNGKIVTEIVEFKVHPDISDADFIQTVSSLEEDFHSRQKGFIDTELVKGREPGHWLMIQHWETMDDAKEVVKMMMKSPITETFRKAIEPSSVKMSLLIQIGTWGKPSVRK